MAPERSNIENEVGGSGSRPTTSTRKGLSTKSKKKALKDIKVNARRMLEGDVDVLLFVPPMPDKKNNMPQEGLSSKTITSEVKRSIAKKEEGKHEEAGDLSFYAPETEDNFADVLPPSLAFTKQQIANFSLGYHSPADDSSVEDGDLTPPENMGIEEILSEIDLINDFSDVLDPSLINFEFSDTDSD